MIFWMVCLRASLFLFRFLPIRLRLLKIELLLLPAKVWKVTLAICGAGAEEDGEMEEDGKNVGEAEAEEWLFWRGRVILSYTGATAKLLSLTCK